jgi:hypothetical protein
MQRVNDMIRYSIMLDGIDNTMMAGFFSALAFEMLLRQGCGLEATDDEKNSCELVNLLCSRGTGYKPFGHVLHQIRMKRNDFIHGKRKDAEVVREIIDGLCLVQNLNPAHIRASLDHEDFERLSKQFRAPDQNKATVGHELPTRIKFEAKHFRDLYRMRARMQELVASLEGFCRELHPDLAFDDVSRVDPKTAYVWAAATFHEGTHRPKVDKPSLSILATNRDIRVYLDFGGRCFRGRRVYLTELLGGGFNEELARLDPDAYTLFDIYWYFNLEPRFTLGRFLALSPAELEQEKGEAKRFLEQVDKKLRVDGSTPVEQLRTRLFNTVSENRLLVGRVFPQASAIEFKDFREVVARTMADLFPVFAKVAQ